MKIAQQLLTMVILLSLFMNILIAGGNDDDDDGYKYDDDKKDDNDYKSTRKSSRKSSRKRNYGGKPKKCRFGRGEIPPFNKRTFDILDSDDCTCNNFDVQYKLGQIATDYNFHVGIISANRNGDDDLPEQGQKQFEDFSLNYIDDDQFYSTALFEDTNIGGSGGQIWNTLDEFLFDGNDQTPSIVELLLNQDTTLIYTNPNWIVTGCDIKDVDDELFEITTLKSLFTLYRRPDNENESDVLQRQFETIQFIRRESDDAFVYLIKSQIFQGTRFSLDNQSKQRDVDFSAFPSDDDC